MALVVDEADCLTPLGVITLENVIEELIQEDIADETDRKRYANMRKKGIEGAVDDLGTTRGSRGEAKGRSKDGRYTRGYDTDSSGEHSEADREALEGSEDSGLSSEASSDDLDMHFRKIIQKQQLQRQYPGLDLGDNMEELKLDTKVQSPRKF